jgi:hypothetical protein
MFTWQFVLLPYNQPLEECKENLDNGKVRHAIQQVAKIESQKEYLEEQMYVTRAIY